MLGGCGGKRGEVEREGKGGEGSGWHGGEGELERGGQGQGGEGPEGRARARRAETRGARREGWEGSDRRRRRQGKEACKGSMGRGVELEGWVGRRGEGGQGRGWAPGDLGRGEERGRHFEIHVDCDTPSLDSEVSSIEFANSD